MLRKSSGNARGSRRWEVRRREVRVRGERWESIWRRSSVGRVRRDIFGECGGISI